MADKEMVNHPAHYGGADNPYEVIKVLEAWSPLMAYHFCIGNCVKYQARAGKKGDAFQGIKKASWYANRAEQILDFNPDLLKEDPRIQLYRKEIRRLRNGLGSVATAAFDPERADSVEYLRGIANRELEIDNIGDLYD